MPVIRKATERDIEAVCRLIGQMSPMGFRHDYTNAIDKFRSHISGNPDYFLWVAELSGNIAGTAMMHLQHKLSYHCGTAAHLEDVVVDQAYRGQGIGAELVREAVTTARQHGCYKIMLTCYPKTAAYYERFGFRQHDIGMRLDLKEQLYDKE